LHSLTIPLPFSYHWTISFLSIFRSEGNKNLTRPDPVALGKASIDTDFSESDDLLAFEFAGHDWWKYPIHSLSVATVTVSVGARAPDFWWENNGGLYCFVLSHF